MHVIISLKETGSFVEEDIINGCRQFFLSIFGTYKQFLKINPNTQKVTFNKKLFIRKQPQNLLPVLSSQITPNFQFMITKLPASFH
jgi:hypothetical protein